MYEYQVVLFMHDYKTHKLSISFNKMYKFNYEVQAIYPTRQTELFHFERCMSPFAEKLPRFNFPHIWNRWSPQIVNIASRQQLKIWSVLLYRHTPKLSHVQISIAEIVTQTETYPSELLHFCNLYADSV